jgi:hypothetical protein
MTTCKIATDIHLKHRKYGVRCRYCDTKWPCDAIQLALENDELRVVIFSLQLRLQKLIGNTDAYNLLDLSTKYDGT